MPWKESSLMDERVCFISRLNDGESMTSLCKEFGNYWILFHCPMYSLVPSIMLRAARVRTFNSDSKC